MVQIKAYRGSEIRRFDIEAGTTFDQLREIVGNLFSISKEDTVTISYCDRDGDIVRLSSDGEFQTALKHLGDQDTWKLQVVVQRKQEAQQRASQQSEAASWWDWNPFHIHFGTLEPSRKGLFDSLWDDDFFGFGHLPFVPQYRLRLEEERKKAEAARRHAMRQASVDAKRASDEVQAQASGGEVAEKKPKVVYRHFGSWEPKVEKGDNFVITTYGPVGYEVTYSHDGEEPAASGEKAQSESKESTKTESTKMES